MVYCGGKLIVILLSNRPHFLWVYRRDKPWAFNQSERAHYLSYFINCNNYLSLVLPSVWNVSPSARDLQAFLVFSQHPAWFITLVNPSKVWSIAYLTPIVREKKIKK